MPRVTRSWEQPTIHRAVDPGAAPVLAELHARCAALRGHLQTTSQPDIARRLDELAITLLAVEALNARAADPADGALMLVVGLKLRELGRALAALTLEAAGYYALAAYDRETMGNEGPVGGELALDAMTDLLGYVGGLDDVTERDRLVALTVDAAAI
jgi:hypothetical protein